MYRSKIVSFNLTFVIQNINMCFELTIWLFCSFVGSALSVWSLVFGTVRFVSADLAVQSLALGL